MKTILKALGLGAALAMMLTLMSATSAHANDIHCTSKIGARTIDSNVIVPRGKTCILYGTVVKGNVYAHTNASLTVRGARVDGNIQASSHRKLVVGTKKLSDGRLKRTVVGGNIQVKSARGGGYIARTITDGDIQLFSNDARYLVNRNWVGGNLQCKGNIPAPQGTRNVVKGNKEGQCRRF